MRILAVESSCDDMSWAIVEDGRYVEGCEVFSQELLHAQTGGVVPEVAARHHIIQSIPVLKKLVGGVEQCKNIDAIAVTVGPGLLGSLLVGISTAQTLALFLKKPLIPVHHIEGHIYANWLEREPEEIVFPLVVLTVSGGHNDLYYMEKIGHYELLGHTLDDAAGEAFDKVARVLELGYPGGPAIERLVEGFSSDVYNFPKALKGKEIYDYSFSGLKSEIRRTVENIKKERGELTLQDKKEIAYGFQKAVTEVLAERLLKAAYDKKAKSICVSGGVSASNALSAHVHRLAAQFGFASSQIFFPKKKMYSTDNAAMIGAAAFIKRADALESAVEICALTPVLSYTLSSMDTASSGSTKSGT